MKILLVLLTISAWSGGIKSTEQVAQFSTMDRCLEAKKAIGHVVYTRMVCLEVEEFTAKEFIK